ncbi:MAG: hypothetical protein Q9208_008567 [Pyrenodesmia sp. 3 TL-2023]
MLLTTPLLLLLLTPLSLAAVAHKGPSYTELEVYSQPSCRGQSRKTTNMQFGSSMTTPFAIQSYSLSRSMGKNDFVKFTNTMEPKKKGHEAKGKEAGKGCHTLKDQGANNATLV